MKFEAEKVYQCIDQDIVVNPMMFHKDFSISLLKLQDQSIRFLEEFSDEGEPIVNPYEIALLYQMQEESQQGLDIDPYFPQSKTQNTHKMGRMVL